MGMRRCMRHRHISACLCYAKCRMHEDMGIALCSQPCLCLMRMCRFSANCKLVRPPNPEADTTAGVPNAEAFWKWLDKAVGTTQKMIRADKDG